MSDRLRDITLALAGVFQAALLVQLQAREGRVPEAPYRASIGSLLRIDAPDVPTVFDGIAGVRLGLETLASQLAQSPQDAEITRYVVSLMYLERRLRRDRDMLATLRAGIERASAQAETFGATHTNVIANLGGTYGDTLSRLRFRILVRGEPVYLENPDNAARVRALLLAGVRAAFLWRQRGGSRLQLFLQRRRILATTRALLAEIGEPVH